MLQGLRKISFVRMGSGSNPVGRYLLSNLVLYPLTVSVRWHFSTRLIQNDSTINMRSLPLVRFFKRLSSFSFPTLLLLFTGSPLHPHLKSLLFSHIPEPQRNQGSKSGGEVNLGILHEVIHKGINLKAHTLKHMIRYESIPGSESGKFYNLQSPRGFLTDEGLR